MNIFPGHQLHLLFDGVYYYIDEQGNRVVVAEEWVTDRLKERIDEEVE